MTFHATTIVAVKKDNKVAIAGDGQVTFGERAIMKANARKVRRLYHGKILAGFAGSVADAFTLFEKFEVKLESYSGNLQRAAVELAKDWRTDKVLRKLEALLLVADKDSILMHGNRLGWLLCACCRARPCCAQHDGRTCDCAGIAVDCGGHLRLYES